MIFILCFAWVFIGIFSWIVAYKHIEVLEPRDCVMLALYSFTGGFVFLGVVFYFIMSRDDNKLFFNPFYND